MEILTKTCSKCKTEKLTTEFNKCSSKKDGLYPSCRDCRKKFELENKEKILSKKREYRENNKDLLNKKSLDSYHKNKDKYKKSRNKYFQEHKEKIAEYQKQYFQDNKEILSFKKKLQYENNKEIILNKQKEYYTKNKKDILEKGKIYRINNIERINEYKKIITKTTSYKIAKRASNHLRNSKIRASNDKTINKKTLIELREKQNNKCYYCNCELDFNSKNSVHLDHYIPISNGGIHSINNVVWSCSFCNLSKHNTMPTTLMLI